MKRVKHVDWSNLESVENWENLGTEFAENENDVEPMMNYFYLLDCLPTDEEVQDIIKNTACTVLYNREENNHYLALTGGGMDLSQDIALAYLKVDGEIPREILKDMYTQHPLSVNEKNFETLMEEYKKIS